MGLMWLRSLRISYILNFEDEDSRFMLENCMTRRSTSLLRKRRVKSGCMCRYVEPYHPLPIESV